MIIRRFRRLHEKQAEHLNITPFMNLMVILIPFLLITAVFTKMAVLEVNLPAANTQTNDVPNELRLEVIIRDNSLVIADGRQRVGTIGKTEEGKFDYSALSTLIQKIKQQNPEAKQARVLLEPDTRYAVLIHVMDALRMVRIPAPDNTGDGEKIPLFPQIALGDAP
ncbi:MAG: biopolymer transporter ExbD [Salinisphaera sp.]|nr:biopolymer transporter ExbD [Salinisphaera sp.]MDN5937382.1 biopolymer transporter ExbD [Salinisphaera sp.]